jgi:hypothetical protein
MVARVHGGVQFASVAKARREPFHRGAQLRMAWHGMATLLLGTLGVSHSKRFGGHSVRSTLTTQGTIPTVYLGEGYPRG